MSSVPSMRQFVCDKLTAAALEILAAFEKRLESYEAEIARQRKMLDSFFSPEIKLHRTELEAFVQNMGKSSLTPFGQIKEEGEEACVSRDRQEPPQQRQTDAADSSPTCEQSVDSDASETPAGHPQTSPNVKKNDKNTTAATSKTTVSIKKTPFRTEPPPRDTYLPSKERHNSEKPLSEKRNETASQRKKEHNNMSAALKENHKNENATITSSTELTPCKRSTNEHSTGSGSIETITLEEHDDDESQESFTIMEPTPQNEPGDKETSAARTDSTPQKISTDENIAAVASAKLGTDVKHDESPASKAPDLEFGDGINESLMSLTLDENYNDAALPEFFDPDIFDLDGEFDQTPNEENSNGNPSQENTEPTLERNSQDERPPAAESVAPDRKLRKKTASAKRANRTVKRRDKKRTGTSGGRTDQALGETSDSERAGSSGVGKPPKMKRFGYATGRKTQKDGDPYKCDRCGKVTSNFKSYKSHMRSHTVGKTLECSTCGKMFREKCDLNKHMVIHSTVKLFTCEVCGKGFNRRYNLELHFRVHTGEKPYKCDTCNKSFSACVNLKKHQRIHTGEKPYACKDCGKDFSDSSAYKIHLRVHSGEKPFKCNFCKGKFATGTTLKRHTRTHTGEKPYKCSVCDKEFGHKTDLKGHMRTHTGEKPYKCSVCDKVFGYKTDLKGHMRIHTGERPKCSTCGEQFSSWVKLNKHKSVHLSKAPRPLAPKQVSTDMTQDENSLNADTGRSAAAV